MKTADTWTFVSKHRGHNIMRNEDGSYSVLSLRRDLEFNTAWSCVVFIDEYLSP